MSETEHDDCADQFHPASKSYTRCRQSNSFREMHGMKRIDGLEERPLEIKTASPLPPRIIVTRTATDGAVVRRGCCGGAATQTFTINANSPPVIKPINKLRTRKLNSKPKPKYSAIERAAKYAEALARHLADDNAATLIADIVYRQQCCRACPFNENDECSLCSCPLKKNLLNNGKLAWRSEQCPAGRWFRHNANRRPLVNPTRNLIFHLYPKRGAEWNWHWHVDQIRDNAAIFNGKIVIGVGVGEETATIEEVKALFDGVKVAEWVVVNNSKLAETLTHVEMMRAVKTDDPNTVTLRMHTKGVTHRRDGVEQAWKELLWETCLDWQSVNDALTSHLICGPLRSCEPLVKRVSRGQFFYAGSAYWFRNKEAFEREWDYVEQSRWWVEYIPGHLFTFAESSCLLHDFTQGSVLSDELWRETIEPEWYNWRRARERHDSDLHQLPEPADHNEDARAAVLVPQ